jgi:hypothetical protein
VVAFGDGVCFTKAGTVLLETGVYFAKAAVVF